MVDLTSTEQSNTSGGTTLAQPSQSKSLHRDGRDGREMREKQDGSGSAENRDLIVRNCSPEARRANPAAATAAVQQNGVAVALSDMEEGVVAGPSTTVETLSSEAPPRMQRVSAV